MNFNIFLALLIVMPTVLAAELGDLTYTVENDEITIIECDRSAEGEIVIPELIEDLPVVAIGDNAFDACDMITSVTMSDQVLSIGVDAFLDCSSLESITLSQSLTRIEQSTFLGCYALESISLPPELTFIGSFAFEECYFTSIVIPSTVTEIEQGAFNECDALAEVYFRGAAPTFFSATDTILETPVFDYVADLAYAIVFPEYLEGYTAQAADISELTLVTATYADAVIMAGLEGDDAAVDADPEVRGVTNGMAYALGMPLSGSLDASDLSRLPTIGLDTSSGASLLSFSLPQTGREGVTYQLLEHTNLSDPTTSWTEVASKDGLEDWSSTVSLDEVIVDNISTLSLSSNLEEVSEERKFYILNIVTAE